jgi:beta-xylosidase
MDWHCFSSDDMEKWSDRGTIFGLNGLVWADKNAGSTDCIKENGKYYLYFTVDSQIGVAVSNSPAGPFMDELRKPLIAKDQGETTAADPNVFIDDNGQPYLLYGQNSLNIVKLKSNLTSLEDSPTKLSIKNFQSGAWMYKRKGLYYISYSSSKSGNGTNLIEYSMSNSPYGPWYYKGKILDNNSKSVQHSIVEFKDKWYLIYHIDSPNSEGQKVSMEPIDFNPDGSIKKITLVDENSEASGGAPGENGGKINE